MNKNLAIIGVIAAVLLGTAGYSFITGGPTLGATPVLRVHQGGTGSSTLGGLLKGNGTSIISVADGSTNWNTAYGWGDHSGKYLGPSYSALATSTFQPIGSYMTAGYSALATSTFVARSDWTTINNYPSACSSGSYVSAIGDTLTCSVPAGGGGATGAVATSTANNITYYPATSNTVDGTSTITIAPNMELTLGAGTETNMYIDATGNVGIGTSAPAYKLDVYGNSRFDGDSIFGTITAGTWNGTAISAAKGGTGQTSYGIGDLLYSNTQTSLSRLATSTKGSVLVLSLSTGLPSYMSTSSLGLTASIPAGTYDPYGQATSTLASHTSTYNHANYDTAYGWGNHSGLYDILGQATGTISIHNATYNHANYDTAYGWGNHAGLYLTAGYSALATSTFQPIGSYLTGAYTAVATSSFQPLGNYLTSAYTAYATSSFVNRGIWTTLDDYPSACDSGQYVSAIGDTLTCSTPAGGGGATGAVATGTIGQIGIYAQSGNTISGTSSISIASTSVVTIGAGTQTNMYIDSTGNVGIGTSSPAYKLDVYGTSRFDGNATFGTIVAGTWNGSSIADIYLTERYLKQSIASTTYQPKGDYLTSAYTAVATSTFVNKANASTTLLSVSGQSWFTGLLNAVNSTLTGLLTTLNATITGVLKIPNGADQLTSSAGELTIDTSTNQLRYYGSATSTLINYQNIGFTYATSSWSGTTTIPLGSATEAETWASAVCYTNAGTLNVVFGDGTNAMNLFGATTATTTNTLSTNNTFMATEKRQIQIGTPASSPTSISCSVKKSVNPN